VLLFLKDQIAPVKIRILETDESLCRIFIAFGSAWIDRARLSF